MTREQLDALARRYLSARFDEIEARLCEPIAEHLHEQEVDHVADRASEVSTWLAHADYRYGLKHALSMLPTDADRETQRKLARRLLEVELEACKAHLRALDGEPLSIPFLGSTSPLPEEPKKTPRFSEVVELFAEDKLAQNAWTARSEAQNRAILAVVCELLGNPRIGDVTKDDIRTFALTLPQLPSNLGKKFRGMSIRQVLEAVSGREDVPRLKPKTINTGYAALRSVFRWAIEHDLIRENPAIVLRDVAEGRARDQRVPFTDADIAAFAAAVDTPTRSTKHNGLSPAERARNLLALLATRGIEPAEIVAAFLAVRMRLRDDPQPDRHAEYRNVQVAKLLHRMAGGTHKRWERERDDGSLEITALHRHPVSRGLVLRALGKQVTDACGDLPLPN